MAAAAETDVARSRHSENEKPKFVEVLMPPGPDGKRHVKTFRLKKNVNNRLVVFERGKVRLTAEGEDRGVQILSEARVRPGKPTPVDDAAAKVLAEHQSLRAEAHARDEHQRAVKQARKRNEPLPEPPSKAKAEAKPEAEAEAKKG